MKINIQILHILILSILVSCKEHKDDNKTTITSINLEDLKKKISQKQVVKKIDTINIDNDSELEYIITTTDQSNSMMYEYWFKKKELIMVLKHPVYDINYKWLVEIDDDGIKEIIRAQGFEDGINYAVYDIQKKEEILLLYFNPALIDEKYPNKIFWAYPWDIKEPLQNNDERFLVSLQNNYERDGEYIKPDSQIELPFIFFKGKTTQQDIELHNLKPQQKILFSDLLKKVIISTPSKESKNKSLIIDKIIEDINKDGIDDKIEVYKNEIFADKFNQEHFQLPIRIYKGTEKGFQLWKENDSIVYDNKNNCVSEGFSDIVVKGEYFTIEAQTCYDYNILVNGYITFKVIEDEIYLHKYVEEYFDKENHENQILTKKCGVKDFGKVKFEDVTVDFLIKLRQNNPK